jgi:hypothetical protein
MTKSDDSIAKKLGISSEVNRGTQDEMQILGIIVAGNHSLRAAVMDRIRQAKLRRDKKTVGKPDDLKAK